MIYVCVLSACSLLFDRHPWGSCTTETWKSHDTLPAIDETNAWARAAVSTAAEAWRPSHLKFEIWNAHDIKIISPWKGRVSKALRRKSKSFEDLNRCTGSRSLKCSLTDFNTFAGRLAKRAFIHSSTRSRLLLPVQTGYKRRVQVAKRVGLQSTCCFKKYVGIPSLGQVIAVFPHCFDSSSNFEVVASFKPGSEGLHFPLCTTQLTVYVAESHTVCFGSH